MQPALGRVEPIQWLRGVAVMLVLIVHAVDVVAAHDGRFLPALPNLAVMGASGVDLFFVISGFVMAHALAAPCNGQAGRFLLARWQRIVPLFMAMSVVFMLVCPDTIAWQSRWMTLTVLPVFDGRDYHAPALFVGWTLGFEFAFYVLVAIAMRRRHDRAWWLLALTTTAALAGIVAHPGWAPLRLLLNPLQLEFALGIGTWLCWRRGLADRYAAPALSGGAALLVIGAVAGLGIGVNVHYDAAVAGSSGLARSWTWGLPWALVMAGLLGLRSHGPVATALRLAGDASYATYLVHPTVLVMAARCFALGSLPPAPAVAMLAGTSLGCGIAVHRFIERPLLAALRPRRWQEEAASPPARPTPSAPGH